MVMKISALFILSLVFSLNAYALEGMITVLDSPLFEKEDSQSKILQYKRKGDKIFIKDEILETPYHKTITRSGKVAFILREHVLIHYNDSRELQNKVISFDHTDYRLEEPLPKSYPLKVETGYKGLFSVFIGNPNTSPYPYKEKIADTSLSLTSGASFVWAKMGKIKDDRRFFFGVKSTLQQAQISYLLLTQKSSQKNIRLSVGPYASYDLFRKENFIINTSFSLQTSLYNSTDITITDNSTDESETRTYSSRFNFSSDLGVDLQLPKAFITFDIVLGINMKMFLPQTYSAESASTKSSFWQEESSSDSYIEPFKVENNYFLGLQSSY